MYNCKHLLVDGWNVIHADTQLRKLFDGGRGMRAAQDGLAKKMSYIHDTCNIRVTIVYDGRGDRISIERIGRQLTFAEVYTPSGMTADELIEQMCANTKHAEDLLVASADNMIRLTSSGFEVSSISPCQLADWIKSGEANVAYFCDANTTRNSRKWRAQNYGKDSPFAELDELAEELRAVERAMQTSLKKKRREKQKADTAERNTHRKLSGKPAKFAQHKTLKNLSELGSALKHGSGKK